MRSMTEVEKMRWKGIGRVDKGLGCLELIRK